MTSHWIRIGKSKIFNMRFNLLIKQEKCLAANCRFKPSAHRLKWCWKLLHMFLVSHRTYKNLENWLCCAYIHNSILFSCWSLFHHNDGCWQKNSIKNFRQKGSFASDIFTNISIKNSADGCPESYYLLTIIKPWRQSFLYVFAVIIKKLRGSFINFNFE